MSTSAPRPRALPIRATLLPVVIAGALIFGCGPWGKQRPTQPLHIDDPPHLVDMALRPAWSPDGRFIAYAHAALTIDEYARGDLQIWLYDVAAESTSYVAPGWDPSWSPRGDSLLFLNGGRVFAYGLVSNTFSQVLGLNDLHAFSWSPTAPLLVLARDYPNPSATTRLWLTPLDGSPARDLSAVGDYQGAWLQPRFSPDGSRIAHIRYLHDASGAEIFAMDTSGTSAVCLTCNDGDESDQTPGWSPDGLRIAWTRVFHVGAQVWVMNADGTGKHLLIASAKEPSWAPDGSQLVVARFVADTVSLWRVRLDGTGVERLPGLPRQVVSPRAANITR